MIPIREIILFGLMMGAGRLLAAGDTPLVVTRVRDLTFGTLFRSSETSVGYEDMKAGEFTVSGEKNRQMRLSVAVETIDSHNGSMMLRLSNSTCAYSLDGIYWSRFSSGALFQDIRFPDNPVGGMSTVQVRIGGVLRTGPGQPRGSYSGRIILAAAYSNE